MAWGSNHYDHCSIQLMSCTAAVTPPFRRMGFVAAALLLLVLASPGHARAQDAALRIAAGPAFAGRAGAMAAAGLELGGGGALGRVELRGTATGRSADWENSARVITLALAGGIATSPASGARRYLLGTAGEGIDPREADRITSLGVVLGGELRRDGRWFGELRYERWLQHGVRHHDLPSNMFAAVVGFTSR